jgi:hypothetical protein
VRTTVTLDPDVADRLSRLAHAQRASFKEVLNAVLRRGLSGQESAAAAPAFVVVPHESGFRPGVDPHKLNELADALETDLFGSQGGT